MLWTYEHDTRDFTDVIKFTDLEMKRLSWVMYFGAVSENIYVITWILKNGEPVPGLIRKEMGMSEACNVGFADGAKECEHSLKDRKGKEMDFPLETP